MGLVPTWQWKKKAQSYKVTEVNHNDMCRQIYLVLFMMSEDGTWSSAVINAIMLERTGSIRSSFSDNTTARSAL